MRPGTTLRAGPVSGIVRPRSVAVVVLALAALLVLMCLNLGRGDIPLGLGDVAAALLGGGDRADRLIVLELRLPRSLTGALVGAALGLSGAITQTIARNPLASPDILGVTSGAGAAVVAAIVLGGSYGAVSGALAAVGVPLAGLAGGLLGGGAVYALAIRRRAVDGGRLILIGIGVTTFLLNVTFWLLSVGQVEDAGRALTWITGSLNARGWEHVWPVALALALLVPAALLGARTLGALQYDDDTARALGLRLERARASLLLAAVALAAVATAAAGPVLFVALAVPQIALRLARAPRPPLAASMALGAALTVGADLAARTAFSSVELPVGVVTAAAGALYLLSLLMRRRREALS